MSAGAQRLVTLLAAIGVAAQLGAQAPVLGEMRLTRSVRVFDYRHRSFPTSIELRGTALLPEAHATVGFSGKMGDLDLTAELKGLPPASKFGAEYLTYVLWAITPEGRPVNVGEILVEAANARLVAPSGKPKVTTDLRAFGFVVTAEPYFAVTAPSNAVVMENEVKPEASGKIEDIEAKYDLLPKGYYVLEANPQEVRPIAIDPSVTFEVVEGRHAVQIARWAGADRYAPETFGVAMLLLRHAELEQGRKNPDEQRVMKTAREAVETAEDARVFALKRKSR